MSEPQIPVPVAPTKLERRAVVLSKLFGWLTAMLLSASVLISLIVITTDRDNLKQQIEMQDKVEMCRSEANNAVNIALAEVVIELFEPDGVSEAAVVQLRDTLAAQEASITDCRNSD
jgi:hypothetical protein